MINKENGRPDEELEDELEDESSEMEDDEELDEDKTDLTEQEILSLLEELKQSAKSDEPFREKATLIETICANKPISEAASQLNFIHELQDPKSGLQLLNNLCLTWSSLINKDRPSVYGVAINNELNSLSAAEVATKIIEYIETEESVADKWHQSAMYASKHGTGIVKIIFNPSSQRVEWQPISIFDCWIENKDNFDKVNYCVIRDYIDKWEAKELIDNVLIKRGESESNSPPSCSHYQDGVGISREGVEKFEIWFRPCARYKKGLYACVIGGTVVEAMNYPYIFPEADGKGQKSLLPIALWTCRKTRGATLGTSFISDCAPIQVNINNLYSKLNDDAHSARQILILPASLRNTDMIDDENSRIFIDSATSNQASIIKWVSPAPLDQNILSALERDVESMYVTAGISQSTSGDAAASQSGRALAFQAQLDSQKHADAFKSFERCQRTAWELSLKLIQKYYTYPQTVNIAGKESISFIGSDLAGVTVRLEPRQERDSSRAAKQELLKQDVSAGFTNPNALSESNPMTASVKIIANDLIDKFLIGEDISLTPESVDPNVMVSTIDERIKTALIQRDIMAVQALQGFKKEYLKMLSSLQVQEPDAGPQPTANQPPSEMPAPLSGTEYSEESMSGQQV